MKILINKKDRSKKNFTTLHGSNFIYPFITFFSFLFSGMCIENLQAIKIGFPPKGPPQPF